MRTEKENDVLVAYPEGRISSANAAEMRSELFACRSADPGRALVIDAGGLEYISSAGLRVLLQLAKEQGDALTVRNVTPEVYEIFEVTGFTSILTVKRKLREISVDGCEVIGSGAIGTVYRVDEDTVVKVYEIPDCIAMIENEQRRAKQAFLKGIPTAISYDVVKVGDKFGSVFEMLKASNYNDLLRSAPERKEEILRSYAHFLRQVHAVEAEPGELPDARAVYMGYLAALREYLPQDLFDRLKALFSAMPENLHLIHGDINMKNIKLSGNEPMLIDMETLSTGDPVFDLQGLYVTYQLFPEDDPGNLQEFCGLTEALGDAVWNLALEYYFDDRGPSALSAAIPKIRIVACVRFLQLICLLDIGKADLKQLRTAHALARLRELAWSVDSLEIGT